MDSMQRGCLICITGLAGSGKSTLASTLKDLLVLKNRNALHITSDDIGEKVFLEKYLEMLKDPNEDYSSEELKTIYDTLFLLFEEVLKNNPSTIIITDGMYRKSSQRLQLRVIAEKLNIPFYLIKIDTPEDIAKSRLMNRSANGGIGGWVDPSNYEEPCDFDLIKTINLKLEDLKNFAFLFIKSKIFA